MCTEGPNRYAASRAPRNKVVDFCLLFGCSLCLQVDFHRPLEEQGPFDVFLHKLTDMIVKAENNDGSQPEAVELFRVLEVRIITASY